MAHSKLLRITNKYSQPVAFSPPPPPPPSYDRNLPPPPPFMTDTLPRPHPGASQSDFLAELEHEQDDLRDARDEVLGARFRLQAQRKELRDLRQESGSKDGHVLSLIYHFLHENNIDLPQFVEEQVEEASELRDQLGLLEADYDEAEMKFNTSEWKYTRKESRFVEGLLDNDFGPNSTAFKEKENHTTADLTRFAGEHPFDRLASMTAETNGSIYTPKVSRSNISHLIPSHNLDITDIRRTSSLRSTWSAPRSTRLDSTSEELAQKAWSEKIYDIDRWLLETTSDSLLQKAQLKAFHFSYFRDDKYWWRQVEKTWNSNNQETPDFHTGDSVMSDQNPDQRTSSSTAKSRNARHLRVNLMDYVPLLVEDQAPDAPEILKMAANADAGDPIDHSGQSATDFLTLPESVADLGAFNSTAAAIRHPESPSSSAGPTIRTRIHSDNCLTCNYWSNKVKSLSQDKKIDYDDPALSQDISEHDSDSAPATPQQRVPERKTLDTPCLVLELLDLNEDGNCIQVVTAAIVHVLDGLEVYIAD
jgi:hypothetical protein